METTVAIKEINDKQLERIVDAGKISVNGDVVSFDYDQDDFKLEAHLNQANGREDFDFWIEDEISTLSDAQQVTLFEKMEAALDSVAASVGFHNDMSATYNHINANFHSQY